MKKTIITIILCVTLLGQLNVPAFSVSSDSYESSVGSVSIKELPDNIKNLVDDYDELAEANYNIDIGETLYDISIPTKTGETEVSVYAVPIKYENEDGDLEFIDTSFADLNIGEKIFKGYDYENAANGFSVLFSKKAEKGFKMDEAFSMSIPTESNDVPAAKIDTDENKDGRLTYDNVYGEGTYIEYININSGVKENIVLEKNIGKNRFEFKWSSETHYLNLSDDNTFINVISKETDEVDYVFSPLYVYDSYTIQKEQTDYTEGTDSTPANFEDSKTLLTTVESNTDSNQNSSFNEIIEEYSSDIVKKIYDITKTSNTMSEVLAEDDTSNFSSDVLEQQNTKNNIDNYEKQNENRLSSSNYVNKHNTDDCYYEIIDNGNGEYTIVAVVSQEFLDSEETVYPVVIDPSVTASSSTSNIEDTYVNESSPDTNYGSWSYMCFGYNNGKRWGYVRFKNLPDEIGCGSQVAIAELTLKFRTGQTTSYTGKMGAIKKKNWKESSLTWNNRISWSGYYSTSDHHNCSYYEFDVTELVQDWYNGDCPNYGVVFTYTNQTYNDYNSVYSSESSLADAPSLRIVYSRVDKETDYYNNNPQSNPNNNYDRDAAKNYALDYAEYKSTAINDTPNYRSTKYSKGGIFNDGDGNNCTNFVSQCLHEGNMAYIGGESTREQMSSWFYDTKLTFYYSSYTWGGATSFAKHWGQTPTETGNQRAYMTIVYEDFWDVMFDWDYLIDTLEPGDVIQYSYDNKDLNHSVIITDVDTEEDVILYAQHTDNKKDVNFYERMEEKIVNDNEMWGVVIHKIRN